MIQRLLALELGLSLAAAIAFLSAWSSSQTVAADNPR